jgi:lipopolysaccharide export system permease protein
MHSESEIAVAYGAGVSRQRIARPILQLAVLAAVAHLAINTVIQPAALRERREIFYELRTDIASSLLSEGAFTYPADDLTLYARERGVGGEMRDLMINDMRPRYPTTYTARAGAIVTLEGVPTIVMRDGQIQRQRDDGALEVIDFDRYPVPLDRLVEEPELFYLKASDRYLHELFFPDLTQHYDQRNVDRFLAEGHARLASPLLNIALAMIGLTGVLIGDFSRRGYARRMMYAAGVALAVELVAVAMPAIATEQPALNPLQYALPVIVIIVCAQLLSGKRGKRKRSELGPALPVRT